MQELKGDTEGATTIFNDNQSSIKMVHNPIMHENTKHIDIHYHFVRELQETEQVDVKYVPSAQQQADILTKPLGFRKFSEMRENVGIRLLPSSFSLQN
jgi:hypothetical protein